MNRYDTRLQIGNAQPSQLGPDSRNINLPWPEKYTDVCSLHRAEEGDEKTKNAVLPQAQECLITALSGFSEGEKKRLRSKPFASLEAIT